MKKPMSFVCFWLPGEDKDGLEEEYNQAIATNIVQELLYKKRRKPSSSVTQKPKPSSRDSARSSASGARRVRFDSMKNDSQYNVIYNIPYG